MKRYIVVFDDNGRRCYWDIYTETIEFYAQCKVERDGGRYEIMSKKKLDELFKMETAKWEQEQNKLMWRV